MEYLNKILSTIKAKSIGIETVKCLMIQSTGEAIDKAGTFYDNIATSTSKRYAHYVLDDTSIYKYCYTGLSVLIKEEPKDFTDIIKKLTTDEKVQDDSPAKHTLVIEICKSGDFIKTEKELIKFCAEFLMAYGLTTDNLWRVDNVIQDSKLNSEIPQYADNTLWKKLLQAINIYIIDSSKEGADPYVSIIPTGAIVPTTVQFSSADERVIAKINSTETKKISDAEDFTKTDTNNVTTTKDNFTKESNITMGAGVLYEPIYPDLTVPPMSSTGLYDGPVENTADLMFQHKPVLGKPVNDSDAYPIDTKIAELEVHRPIIHIKNVPAPSVESLSANLVELSHRTEKRVVQLENVLASVSRYLFRLSSRMNINCVYYGGQSVFDKYNCIRCLHDDLINDAQIVSIDRCLNCSRYEPILGQVYDILEDDYSLSMAPILDNMQAARMTPQQYAEFTRVEEILVDYVISKIDLTKLNLDGKEDKPFIELLEKEIKTVMDWTEVEFDSQKPDVNMYEYDRAAINKNKAELLKTENKYKDGYDKVKKKEIVVPIDEYNSSTGVGGTSEYNYIDQYDYTNAKARQGIVETARKIVALCKQGKAIYTYGGEIPVSMLKLSVDQLVAAYGKTLEIDCSEFIEYCFISNGVHMEDGSNSQLAYILKNGTKIGKTKDLAASIKDAMPGDVIFFGSSDNNTHHVGLYVGDGKMCDASTHHKDDPTRDITERLISKGSQDFYCIVRLNSLPLPKKISGTVTAAVNLTLAQMAQIQLKESTNPGEGDGGWCKSIDEIIPYLDPSKHNSGNDKFQFLNLRGYVGATAEQIKAFLTKKNASPALINNSQAFIDGAKKYNVNELYLVVHCGLETGWGKSTLGKGSTYNGKMVYNMYGINARNEDALALAQQYAYSHGWFDTATAIIEGAQFIGANYINSKYGQNTLYKMRWNPNFPGQHQYATDTSWALQQAPSMASLYTKNFPELLPKLIFETPIYKV
jgi:beta-N-acetylglucosaminidase/cell wall-associated NlpC family hydrolase